MQNAREHSPQKSCQETIVLISADPVVQQGGARPEMVCSVVSIVAIRCATASLSRNPTPKCFWCSVHRFLCPCNSGIACRDPSSKCLWCSVHRFLCLEQWSSVPQQWNSCQNLDFFIPFRSGVWRQRDGRRLFRHAVPGCFPDSKGVLWLGLCAWNNCLPDP